MADFSQKIIIVGAGIAGLSAAIYLREKGYENITFIEESDRPGGRLKTEYIDGYTLNIGFHLYNTAYSYAEELLDTDALNLKYLDQGVLLINEKKLKKILTPLKKHLFIPFFLLSNFGTLNDRIKFVKKRLTLKQMDEDEIFDKYEIKSSSILKKMGFSSKIIESFFRPYFSSIFLEEELITSRRMLDYYLKMNIEGNVGIPSKGIEAIPLQLSSQFSKENFVFNSKVVDYTANKVITENGDEHDFDCLVLTSAQIKLKSNLKNERVKKNYLGSTCLYFSSDKKPYSEPLICINSNNPKLISNITVLTNISKLFAPKGKELISVTLNGFTVADDKVLENEVRKELLNSFGTQIDNWKIIKIYRIEYALQSQEFITGKGRINEMRLESNVYVCGDYLFYGNIDAAVKSGKLVSEIMHKDLNPNHKIVKKKKYSSLFEDNSDSYNKSKSS